MKEIPVEIFGHTYHLSTELDATYLDRLAATVDEKMRTLAESTNTMDSRRLAVLTALNIADKVEELKEMLAAQALVSLPSEFARRLAECNRLLASRG